MHAQTPNAHCKPAHGGAAPGIHVQSVCVGQLLYPDIPSAAFTLVHSYAGLKRDVVKAQAEHETLSAVKERLESEGKIADETLEKLRVRPAFVFELCQLRDEWCCLSAYAHTQQSRDCHARVQRARKCAQCKLVCKWSLKLILKLNLKLK